MFSINTYSQSRTLLFKRKQLRKYQKSMSSPEGTLKSPWFWKVRAGLGRRKCYDTVSCYYFELKFFLIPDTASLPQVNEIGVIKRKLNSREVIPRQSNLESWISGSLMSFLFPFIHLPFPLENAHCSFSGNLVESSRQFYLHLKIESKKNGAP